MKTVKNTLMIIGICAAITSCSLFNPPDTAPDTEILDFGDNGSYPFSDAARAGKILFLSGSLGIVPGEDNLVPGGIVPETKQAMDNLKLYTEESGYQMKDILKCTVFLADMSEWSAFNDVYGSYFKKPFPARTAVAVKSLALDARVEIECIASR